MEMRVLFQRNGCEEGAFQGGVYNILWINLEWFFIFDIE